jgi:uncharacterized repeat protein (TIGR02543 family)
MKKIFLSAIFLALLVSCSNTIDTSNSQFTSVTVTFDSRGGTEVSNQVVPINSLIMPPIVTNEGHTLLGWHTSINGGVTLGNAWNFFIDRVNFDFTLYASWEVNEYTISFDTNEGSLIPNQLNDFGSTLNIPSPTKVGYTFSGWYSNSSLTQVFELSTMPAINLTLYAKWTINQYTITFETNEGTLVSPITQDYNSSLTPPNEPSRIGHTFIGWFTDETFNNIYTFPLTMPSENITLFAWWAINQYTITFHLNGGVPGDLYTAELTLDYGTDLTTLEIPIPTKVGHTFLDWFGDETLLTLYTSPLTMPAENINLYAKWTINQYTIRFDTNGGSEVASIAGDYGSDVIPPNDPTKEGYVFKGWFFDTDTRQVVDIIAQFPDYNVQYFALWVTPPSSLPFIRELYDTGSNHSLDAFYPMAERKVYSNGQNENGQLGYETDTNFSLDYSLVLIPDLLENELVYKISAGHNYSLALTNLGNVYSWGLNDYGQLGINSPNEFTSIPQRIPLELDVSNNEIITHINAGYNHALALSNLGNVYGWGYNGANQIKSSDQEVINLPTKLQHGQEIILLNENETIIDISSGENFSVFFTNFGNLYFMGDQNFNYFFNLYDNATSTQLVTFESFLPNEIIRRFVVGRNHVSVLTQLGNVYMFGQTSEGQNGLGASFGWPDELRYEKVHLNYILDFDESIIAINTLDNSTMVLTSKFRTIGWGDNTNDVLLPSIDTILLPTEINIYHHFSNTEWTIEGYPIYIAGNSRVIIFITQLDTSLRFWYYYL